MEASVDREDALRLLLRQAWCEEMKWRFDCFVCGLRWEEHHKDIHASDFIFSEKKEGRPMVNCPDCSRDDIHTPLMGDMVGQRT